jgi:uncharacterized membrane protein YbhN (UPF0104 family)
LIQETGDRLPSEPAARRLREGMLRLAVVAALVVGAVVLLPGLGGVRQRFAHVGPAWIALAIAFEVLSALSYVALFHPLFCPRVPWRLSYRIGMAEVGITALLPAAGAGGLALGVWVLRRRGMAPELIASRTVAFFLLTSAVNLTAVALFGFGLAAHLFHGRAPFGLTVVPGLVAVTAVSLALGMPLLVRRRGSRRECDQSRAAALLARAARSIAAGVDDSRAFLRSGDPLVYAGAIGYWAFDNAVLWVCFRATGHPPPVAVVASGYLIGQLASALPLPAGIGGVDLGLIGTFVLLHVPLAAATAAVLTYRAIQVWVPAVLGGVSLARLPSALGVEGSGGLGATP